MDNQSKASGHFIENFTKADKKRILLSFLGVFGMGFFLSFLVLCDLGTDPCTFMNRSISSRIGMSFGNWQLLLNTAMFLIVLIFRRKLIGWGTLFNMVLVGYYVDFFTWIWGKNIADHIFTDAATRWPVFLVSLFLFMVSAAVYINAETGVAPYDGLPIILTDVITSKFPVIPKTAIRICWDGLAIVIGVLFGGMPIVGIILMALFLGPLITLVGKKLKPLLSGESNRRTA